MSEKNPQSLSPGQRLADRFAVHLARWYQETHPEPSEATGRLLMRAAREASLATAEGHVCADLSEWTEDERAGLQASGLVACPEEAGVLPLVLDGGARLYLQRYFQLERTLADALIGLAKPVEAMPSPLAEKRLNELFDDGGNGEADWQKLAAGMALLSRLTIISGGPGTGKTTTVIKLLACLLTDQPDCRIALAAPTGKAAARMVEALHGQVARLSADGMLPPELAEKLPREARTLHRLLGVRPEGGFRHDRDHPLAIDLLVVDEASMLDLALASRLLEALPDGARLILLGDKNQLAAVEAGAVFAEIAADAGLTPERVQALARLTQTSREAIVSPPAIQSTPLSDAVVWFTRNYRFHEAPGIGELASMINQRMGETPSQDPPALVWLKSGATPNITWVPDEGEHLSASLQNSLLAGYADYIASLPSRVTESTDLAAIFAAFNQFRVLCAIHDTARGMDALNRSIAESVRRHTGQGFEIGPGSDWYSGRPIMVLSNDYTSRLFNGDIGIALYGGEEGALQVYFPAEGGDGYRAVPLVRLPEHDTAFAMTVHKSQGSEFPRIALVLPAVSTRVVTRELLYTGVTRARSEVLLVSPESVLKVAISKRTSRRSGLLARLQESRLTRPV